MKLGIIITRKPILMCGKKYTANVFVIFMNVIIYNIVAFQNIYIRNKAGGTCPVP